MKRLVLLLLLVMPFVQTYGQYKVSGVVKGEDSAPLQGVVITAYNNNKLLKYTVSGVSGSYALNINGDFTHIDYYMMGYRRVSYSIDMNGVQSLEKNVVLQEAVMNLPTITVKPVAIKVEGDTVTYDASSFVREQDNSLKQVLNRLPNVSVTKSGTVKIQGVNVNKVYIEDMDLLGGRYPLAVNNLKPEDIASVSVYYNHQPIKALKTVERSEQHALNIKLKEKAKGRWILSFEGGAGGADFIYEAKVRAMNFGKKGQTMIIGKSGNNGEDIISETKIQNLGVGVFNVQEVLSGGVSDLFSISRVSLPVPAEYYYNNRSNAVSILNLSSFNSGNTLRESLVFTTDADVDNVITKEIVIADNIVIADSLERQRNQLQFEGDFTFTSNRDKSYLENKLSFKGYSNSAQARLNALQGGYSIDYSLPKIILDNDLDIVYKRGGKTRKLNGDFHFSNLNQQMAVKRDGGSSLFDSDVVVQNFYTENLTAALYTSFIKGKGTSTYTFEPGTNLWYKEYKSVMEPYADSLYNSLYLFSVQPYMNIKYQYKGRRLNLNVGLPLGLRGDWLMGDTDMYLLYNPSVSLEYRVSGAFKFKGSATVGNSIEDIDKMAGNYIYTGYRNLYSYSVLPKDVSQSYSASLNYSNYSSYLFAGLSAMYRSNYRNVMGQTSYREDYTFTEYVDMGSRFDYGTVRADVKKRLGGSLIVNAGAEYSYNSYQQYIQGKLYNTSSDGYAFGLGFDFEPCDNFSIDYDGKVSFSELRGGSGAAIRYCTNQLKVNWFPVEKLLVYGELYHYQNSSLNYGDKKVATPFVDFKVEYKFSKKFSVNCNARNVLDVKSYDYSYFGAYSEIVRKTVLRGAEFMVGMKLDL